MRSEIEEALCEWSKTLELSDFDQTIHVVHEDGSTFLLPHSVCCIFYSKGVKWLFVATEHNGNLYFSADDLASYRRYDRQWGEPPEWSGT